jgi:hypothetical protein
VLHTPLRVECVLVGRERKGEPKGQVRVTGLAVRWKVLSGVLNERMKGQRTKTTAERVKRKGRRRRRERGNRKTKGTAERRERRRR